MRLAVPCVVVGVLLGAVGCASAAPTTSSSSLAAGESIARAGPLESTTPLVSAPAFATAEPTPAGSDVETAATTPEVSSPAAPSGAGGSPSQTPADAKRDSVFPELARLPFDQRVGILATATAPEGVWAVSRMLAAPVSTSSYLLGDPSGDYGRDFINTVEYGEILLLNPSKTRILRAFPFLGVPPQRLVILGDSVYCERQGDGALPDSMLCRIDRFTFDEAARIFPPADEPLPNLYMRPGWRVEAPEQEAIFQELDVRGGQLRIGDASGRQARIDPATLEIVGSS